jgi:hypothetical protein
MCKRLDGLKYLGGESDIKILFGKDFESKEFFEHVRVFRKKSVLDERGTNGVEPNPIGQFAGTLKMRKEKFFERVHSTFEEPNPKVVPVHTQVFRVRMDHARYQIERGHNVRQTFGAKKFTIVCHTVRLEDLMHELFDTVRCLNVPRLDDLKI